MTFSNVLGQQHIKSHLTMTVKDGRIPHTQLFIGKSGSGLLPLALSYANEILCQSHEKESVSYINCKTKINRCVLTSVNLYA